LGLTVAILNLIGVTSFILDYWEDFIAINGNFMGMITDA